MNGDKNRRLWTLPLVLLLFTLVWALGYNNGIELIPEDWTPFIAWFERRIPMLSFMVPIVFAGVNMLLLCLALIGSRRAERIFQYSGDNGAQYARAVRRLKGPLLCCSVAKIVNFLFFTVSAALAGYPYQSDNLGAMVGIAGMFLLLIGFAWVMLIQRRCTRMPEFYSAENQSSITVRSRRNRVEDYDEAEQWVIYKAAYRAYTRTKTACVLLWALSLAAQLLLHASMWPGVCICLIYLIQTLSFARGNSKESRR